MLENEIFNYSEIVHWQFVLILILCIQGMVLVHSSVLVRFIDIFVPA